MASYTSRAATGKAAASKASTSKVSTSKASTRKASTSKASTIKASTTKATPTFTEDKVNPGVPPGLTAVYITCTSITLRWDKATDNVAVKGYNIYRNGRKLVSTSSTSYTNKGLTPGWTYTYSIRAYDAAGNMSGYGNTVKAATKNDMEPPTTPGIPIASGLGLSSVSLEWEPSTDNVDIKQYEVFCNDRKVKSTSQTYWTCDGLVPGTTYNFHIKAVDISGNKSQSGGSITVTMASDTAAPSTPSGFRATNVAETEAVLNWSPASDNVRVTGYEITCNGVKKGTSTKTTFKCKGLTPGTSYVYTVRAFDNAGNTSGYSSIRITTIKDNKAPTAPTKLKYEREGTSVDLEWNASTDDVKLKCYYIYKNGIKVAETTKTSKTVKVSAGIGVHIFQVKAVDIAGNVSGASNSAVVVTV
jgi:chitodextrinase